MAQSINTRVDVVVEATSYQGLTNYGKIMVGDKGFEFFNTRNVNDYIQIPWEEVDYVIASVMFKGKKIPRYAIQTKKNGTFSFSSKEPKKVLRAINQYIPSERLVRSLSFFDVLKRNFMPSKKNAKIKNKCNFWSYKVKKEKMAMGHILRMNPVFKEMIWGGTKLKDIYGYEIPSDHTGECWAISAHKNGDCTIADGEYKGKTLSWLFENHRELFGNIEGDQFPLLVKIIDAKNDLSVQVHPDDVYAKEHENSLGKTECWFVLQADEETKMVMGHHAKTKDEFVKAIENDDYDNLLNSFKIKAGDFFYIPSGTLHAICSGSLIYEAQQSSDITYRVYDYHRKDADGNERQLHVQQSIDVTNVPADIDQNKEFPQTILENGTKTRYVDSEFFKVDRYQLNGKNVIKNDEPFMMVSIIEGTGIFEGNEVKKGDHFVICSDQKEVTFDGDMEVMISTL